MTKLAFVAVMTVMPPLWFMYLSCHITCFRLGFSFVRKIKVNHFSVANTVEKPTY